MTSFLYKLQTSHLVQHSSQLYAPPGTTRPSEVFRESPPEVSALSDHGDYDGDGDIQDESEGDPATPTVDGGHLRRRRSVHAIT